jgi:DNA gyrase inhibitor GyrI
MNLITAPNVTPASPALVRANFSAAVFFPVVLNHKPKPQNTMNKFESLSAENPESRLAQVSYAETAPDNDEPLETPEEKYQARLDGCALTRASWAMLRAIHAEIDGGLDALREVEKFQLADGRVI